MVMKFKLEDKPNLFRELAAWRQLGFNAFKIPPATTMYKVHRDIVQ